MPLPIYGESTPSLRLNKRNFSHEKVPSSTTTSYNTHKQKIAVAIAAGKGGVGKSAITVNLALALKEEGFSVGILDADLYGPSIRKMLPEETPPEYTQRGLKPALSNGIKIISAAFFHEEKEPNAFRAPIANKILSSLLEEVDFGQIDFLLIDFPPGTGDIQLTLSQKIDIFGALLVTTPQEIALIDVRKSAALFEKMNIPILGVVENMSYYLPTETAEPLYLFGQGGGKKIAEETQTPLLSEIPIHPLICSCLDQGISLFHMQTKEAAHPVECFRSLKKLFLTQIFSQKKASVEAPVRFIVQENQRELMIEWPEGMLSFIHLDELQSNCPCADCRKKAEPSTLTLPSSKEEVRALSIRRVGNYGIAIEFTSGCSKGIYSFDYLRQFKV